MKIHIYRGFHSEELKNLVHSCWKEKELLILVPVYLKDFSFLDLFNTQDVSFYGKWEVNPLTLFSENKINISTKEKVFQTLQFGIFTSGTVSGTPRLVFYTRENVLSSLEDIRELYETHRIQSLFCYPQPSHTFGLVLGYLHSVVADIPLYFKEGAYGREAHDLWLQKVNSNMLTLGTPTHFIDLMNELQKKEIVPPGSYSCIVGGARVQRDLWDQIQTKLKIEKPSIGYGATEASPGVTHLPPGVFPKFDGDIGNALRRVKIQLIPGRGLQFSGPNVCQYIFENRDLVHSPEILLKDDILSDETEGKIRYYYQGRTDYIINRGGLKISLEQYESKISEELQCKVVAFSFFDDRLGQEIGLLLQRDTFDDSNFKKIQQISSNEFGFQINKKNIITGTVPLTMNGKLDRLEALRILNKNKTWAFPVDIQHLTLFLPHRGSAIWIDSILENELRRSVGQVRLNSKAHYFSPSGFRETSCIEFVAQTYGYSVILNDFLNLEDSNQVQKAFIAEVKNVDFFFKDHPYALVENEILNVEVLCTHHFGELKVVQGQVFHKSRLLAKMNLKLYSK